MPDAARSTATAPAVLVVDDEEMVRKLAATMLRRHGYRIDLAMPAMGGDELAPVFARRCPRLGIVITSGLAEEDARKAVSRGFVYGFLQKPYTIAGLKQKAAEVLGAADAGEAAG